MLTRIGQKRPGLPHGGVSAVLFWALGSALLGCVGCGPQVDFKPQEIPRDQTVVVLNGEPLSLEEFDSEFRLMAIHYGAVGEIEMRSTKRRLFDQVVDRHLMVQHALRSGLGVTRKELEAALRDALRDGPADFLDQLKAQGIRDEVWKSKMAQEILVQKLAEREVYPGVRVSDGEVEAHYWSHLDEYWIPESVRVRHLVVRTPKELKRVQECLKSGEAFPQVCAKFSVDPQKDSGGDWGWMPMESLAPSYVKALRALKDGEVSKPLKDAFGYHLFQRLEHRPTRVRTLEEAAPLVRERLVEMEKDRRFAEWLTKLKKDAKVEVNPDLSAVVGIALEEPRDHALSKKKPVKKSKPKAKKSRRPQRKRAAHQTARP